MVNPSFHTLSALEAAQAAQASAESSADALNNSLPVKPAATRKRI